MAGIQLNLVVIRSTHIDRAASFYRLLGLEFVKHSHGSGPDHFACMLDSVVFEIYPRQNDADSTHATRLGFQVAAVDAVVAELRKAGVRILSPPRDSPWGRRAVVEDPDGHKVELTEASIEEDFHDQSA